MHRLPNAALLLAIGASSGCHSYAPAPVDLAEHARAFAARLADASALLAEKPAAPGAAPFDLGDGIDRREAHLLALWFHPDGRLARRRAGVAEVVRDEAGRWVDPTLDVDVARILETVPHPWLVVTRIGFTLPLSGRLQLERDLATAAHATALVEARTIEAELVRRTDAAFAHWRADRRRADLLRDLCARLGELEAIAVRLAAAGERTQQEARAFTLERLLRQAELAQSEAAAAGGELTLKRLLGLHPTAPVHFVPDPALALQVPDAAERRLQLSTGPRLAALQLGYEQSERALRLEIRKQWPDLVLSPGLDEEDAQLRLALGLSLPLPLFTGNTPAIRRAEAEREAAAEALRGRSEQAVHDLAAAELQLAAAERQRELVAAELVPLAQQQVADVRRLAELGQLEPLLMLDALVRAHTAGMQAIAADLAAAEATVAIDSLFWNDPPTAARREARR
ncbi:MAG: TolC family protein [Planctomycetes bacterium]|nr:TolC family protein [Planctomycetota bacterium]